MRYLLLYIISLLSVLPALGQPPEIEWQRYYGSSGSDVVSSIIATNDSGYLLAGSVDANDGDVTCLHGQIDAWLLKLAKNGDIQWQQCFGRSRIDHAGTVIQLSDGDYLMVGSIDPNDSLPPPYSGASDCMVAKVSASGEIIWQMTYGGSLSDGAVSVVEALDGGYVVAGGTASDDGDVSGGTSAYRHSGPDIWIFKLSRAGDIVWQKCLGSALTDRVGSIIRTSDNSYLVSGIFDGDEQGLKCIPYCIGQFRLIKIDDNGSVVWEKNIEDGNGFMPCSMRETYDGGAIVCGYKTEYMYDEADEILRSVDIDWFTVRTTSTGEEVWHEVPDNIYWDRALSVVATSVKPTQGYVVAGMTYANDTSTNPHHMKKADGLLRMYDAYGMLQWTKSIGNGNSDGISSTAVSTDNGLIAAGNSFSVVSTTSGNYMRPDMWVVKLKWPVPIDSVNDNEKNISIAPNPTSDDVVVTGVTKADIHVLDMTGRLLANAVQTNTISLAGFPPAIYLIKVFRNGELILRQKIQKK